jgi:hypothetical protein
VKRASRLPAALISELDQALRAIDLDRHLQVSAGMATAMAHSHGLTALDAITRALAGNPMAPSAGRHSRGLKPQRTASGWARRIGAVRAPG